MVSETVEIHSSRTKRPFSVLHAKPLDLDLLTDDELDGVRVAVFANLSEPDAFGCRRWLGARNSEGYAYHHLRHVGNVRANRLIWELTHGVACPPHLVVDHTCNRGHEGCCEPSHLQAITQTENNLRIIRAGHHNTAKLDERKVRLIRYLYRHGWTYKQLAHTFGVGMPQISRIINRKRWGWVEDQVAA